MVNIADLLIKGTRRFQKAQGVSAPVENDDFTTKQYVDEQIISGTGIISGSGTLNKIPKFVSGNTIVPGTITDNGLIGINVPSPTFRLEVNDTDAIPARFLSTETANDDVPIRVLSLDSHYTPGAMIGSFGCAIRFRAADSAGVFNNQAQIETKREGADDSAALVFAPFLAGSIFERMRISSDGNIGIGTTASVAKLSIRKNTSAGAISTDLITANENLHIAASDFCLTRIIAANASGHPILLMARSRGDLDTPTIVSDNDITGDIQFRGHDGAGDIDVCARIIGRVDDPSPDPVAVGGDLAFFTNTTAGVLTQALLINNAQQCLFADGSISAPSISFFNEIDTGMSNPDTDNLAFSTGGIEAFRVDENQRIGIGITNPSNLLTVSLNDVTISTDLVNSATETLLCASQSGTFRSSLVLANNTGTTVPVYRFLRARGTLTTPTIVSDNDRLGDVQWHAHDGDTTDAVALIRCTVDDASPADGAVGGDLQFFTNTTAGSFTEALRITSAQLTGLARTPTTNRLEVNGDASKTAAATWLANSDRRIKTEIMPVTNALNRICALKPVSFRYKDAYRKLHGSIGDHLYYNFIAQEYQEVFPDSVKISGDEFGAEKDILQIETHSATIYAVAAIQELHEKIKSQQIEIDRLKAKVN